MRVEQVSERIHGGTTRRVLLCAVACVAALLGAGSARASSAPTVVTEPASGVAQTSATLNATVNPNGGEVSGCTLEYGTTTAYGSSVACSPAPGAGNAAVPGAGAVTGLTANTTYHFRASATNAGGTGVGSDQTLTTPPSPPTVVTEPAS